MVLLEPGGGLCLSVYADFLVGWDVFVTFIDQLLALGVWVGLG